MKTAELLVDLRAAGRYRISRRGFYQRAEQHDPDEAAEVWRRFMDRETPAPAES